MGSLKSAMCRRVRCDARRRRRRHAGSKAGRRAPTNADSATGCPHNARVRRRRWVVEIVAECTAPVSSRRRPFLVNGRGQRVWGCSRAADEGRGRRRHVRNVTAMKKRTSRPKSSNTTLIIRRGEMRCRKRLPRVSCQTRPCHARGDGASSPVPRHRDGASSGLPRSRAEAPRAEAHCSADDHRDGCAQIEVALVASSIRLADK